MGGDPLCIRTSTMPALPALPPLAVFQPGSGTYGRRVHRRCRPPGARQVRAMHASWTLQTHCTTVRCLICTLVVRLTANLTASLIICRLGRFSRVCVVSVCDTRYQDSDRCEDSCERRQDEQSLRVQIHPACELGHVSPQTHNLPKTVKHIEHVTLSDEVTLFTSLFTSPRKATLLTMSARGTRNKRARTVAVASKRLSDQVAFRTDFAQRDPNDTPVQAPTPSAPRTAAAYVPESMSPDGHFRGGHEAPGERARFYAPALEGSLCDTGCMSTPFGGLFPSPHAPGRWLVIESDTAFLHEFRGMGQIVNHHLTRFVRWMSATACSDSVVWITGQTFSNVDTDPLVSVRSDGGVTIQMYTTGEFGAANWPSFQRAVHEAIGPLQMRAKCTRAITATIDTCSEMGDPGNFCGPITGAFGSGGLPDLYDRSWPMYPRTEVLRTMLAMSDAMDRCVQERVRLAVKVTKFKCRRARRVISQFVSDNLQTIKARLWHPDGVLMKRRFLAMNRS